MPPDTLAKTPNFKAFATIFERRHVTIAQASPAAPATTLPGFRATA